MSNPVRTLIDPAVVQKKRKIHSSKHDAPDHQSAHDSTNNADLNL